jgi:hypothetical protein
MRNAISALLICLVLGCAVRAAQAPGQAEASTVCLMDESEVIEIGKRLAGQMGWKVKRLFPGALYDRTSGKWRVAFIVIEGDFYANYFVYVKDRSGQVRHVRRERE